MQVTVTLKKKVLTGSLIAWNEGHPKYKGNVYIDDQKYIGFVTHDNKVVLNVIYGFTLKKLGTFNQSI